MLPLRASGSYRWTRCAAAPLFASRRPEQPESDAAREGTCAAWVAETIINGDAGCAYDMLGKVHANGWEVDEEMALHIQRYVDLCEPGGRAEVAGEKFTGAIVGTADFVHVDSYRGVLTIRDLKYGQRVVEVVENPQLKTYAAMQLADTSWQTAELCIYQPRSAHPDGIHRVWRTTRERIVGWCNTLADALHYVQQPQPTATPGDHCRDCPAAATCQALAESTYAAHDTIAHTAQYDMTADQIAAELSFLDRAETLLKARAAAVRAEAEARIAAGAVLPGWGLKAGQSNRVWKYPVETLRMLLGVDVTKTVPRTPADVEREGINVDAFVTRNPGKPKLARLTPADVERMFNRK